MQWKLQNEGSMEVHVLYKEFTDRSAAALGMVWYLETLLKFVSILISVDREENWKGHLQVIQDMRPVFCRRYFSLYLQMIQKIPKEHSNIYKVFMEWKSKKSVGFSNAVAPDMKLEQISPRRLQVVSLIKRNRTLLWLNGN